MDKKTQCYGRGIRFDNSANILKAINAEINTTQNKILAGLGLAAAVGVYGYITYVRHKHESLGYYMALGEDGRTEFRKKTSNWES